MQPVLSEVEGRKSWVRREKMQSSEGAKETLASGFLVPTLAAKNAAKMGHPPLSANVKAWVTQPELLVRR